MDIDLFIHLRDKGQYLDQTIALEHVRVRLNNVHDKCMTDMIDEWTAYGND